MPLNALLSMTLSDLVDGWRMAPPQKRNPAQFCQRELCRLSRIVAALFHLTSWTLPASSHCCSSSCHAEWLHRAARISLSHACKASVSALWNFWMPLTAGIAWMVFPVIGFKKACWLQSPGISNTALEVTHDVHRKENFVWVGLLPKTVHLKLLDVLTQWKDANIELAR